MDRLPVASPPSSPAKAVSASGITPARGFAAGSAPGAAPFSLRQAAADAVPSPDEPHSANEFEAPQDLAALTVAGAAPELAPPPMPLTAVSRQAFDGQSAAPRLNHAAPLGIGGSMPQAAGPAFLTAQTAQAAQGVTSGDVLSASAAPISASAAADPQLAAMANPLGSPAASASPPHSPVASPASAMSTETGPEWAALRVDPQSGKWGEQMLQVLHDRVTLQAQQQLQEARIRLDPPELGKLDLVVRLEGDRLSVQLHANATATREALLQVSDRLRAELQSQHFVHVDVNVGSGQSDQRRSSGNPESSATILAANDSFSEAPAASLSEHWLSTHA